MLEDQCYEHRTVVAVDKLLYGVVCEIDITQVMAAQSNDSIC